MLVLTVWCNNCIWLCPYPHGFCYPVWIYGLWIKLQLQLQKPLLHTTSVCYFQPFNSSLYILHKSHYCTQHLYVIFSHSTVPSIYCIKANTAHHICMLFSAIQHFPLYTALNRHYSTPHLYVIFSHSRVPSIYCITATTAHHICMLFSAIQQYTLYTALNSHYCTPHLYVIFSHSTVPSIYCT